jgi:molybdenum cofactor cytidylyltransferase
MKRYDIQLVAEDVKRSFLRSGKRHILITGKKGAGKTTLARILAGEASAGFSSRAVPHSRVLLRDNLTGEECVIGQYSSEMGRMVPVYEGFSQLGVKSLKASVAYDGAVLLDEIGYLESDADDFKYAVEMVLAKKDTILTVRREDTEFILKLKSRSDVFVVDLDILYGGVGCVIMASGYSKRFGSNKLLEDFCGAKLIEHAIFATDGMFG